MNIEWKKARKKPVVIEYREPIPNKEVYIDYKNKIVEKYPNNLRIHCWGTPKSDHLIKVERIETFEGVIYAIPNIDLVIKGIKGEIYPIKKDIFLETYEELK